ncbi:hypothetical protein [Capnocytophaga granulosa]
MKNFLRKNWLGLLAILISVGTWLSFWLRFSPFTWDSFGAITAIMGIMITFLVGVQIISIVDFKSKIDELKEKEYVIKDLIITGNLQEIYMKAEIKMNIAEMYLKLRSYNDYMRFYLEAVESILAVKLFKESLFEETVDKVNIMINGLVNELENVNIFVTEEEKISILELVYSIKKAATPLQGRIEKLKKIELMLIHL